MSMLLVGGVPALQNATIIMGLPFAFVIVLVMAGLYKALRVEANRADSHRQSLPGRLSGRTTPTPDGHQGRSWRQRLGRSMSFPSVAQATEFVDEVALPALREVAEELHGQGVDARADKVSDDGVAYVELVADLGTDHPFHYQVWPREVPIPIFGRGPAGHDTYARLEVHLREGGQGYDVMGYTHTQLIDDVLDQYERHLEFLRLNDGITTA
jgi:choline/glycine/proline betaine transport protein